jgi:hypothetical protein
MRQLVKMDEGISHLPDELGGGEDIPSPEVAAAYARVHGKHS